MTDMSIHKRIKLEELDCSLSSLRITRPADLGRMRQSLERSGQLNPIVVRPFDERFQILDGFKRFTIAGDLGWESLEARILDISLPEGKAADVRPFFWLQDNGQQLRNGLLSFSNDD